MTKIATIFILIRGEFIERDNNGLMLVTRLQRRGALVFASLTTLFRGL